MLYICNTINDNTLTHKSNNMKIYTFSALGYTFHKYVTIAYALDIQSSAIRSRISLAGGLSKCANSTMTIKGYEITIKEIIINKL